MQAVLNHGLRVESPEFTSLKQLPNAEWQRQRVICGIHTVAVRSRGSESVWEGALQNTGNKEREAQPTESGFHMSRTVLQLKSLQAASKVWGGQLDVQES